MLIEVANSGIAWTEPKDFSVDTLAATGTKSVPLSLCSNHGRRVDFFVTYEGGACGVAMADGRVRDFRLSGLSAEHLRKILQIDGCGENGMCGHGDIFDRGRLNWLNITSLAVWLLSVGSLLTLP